ncbi:MAG: EamA family transporter [Pseudomonadota bacterium]
MSGHVNLRNELCLLGLLALLWGSSYLFAKVALKEIPPLTLVAIRVFGAAVFLTIVMRVRNDRFPKDAKTWRMLLVQSVVNAIAAWTILAWGQQHVDAGLASVLNSTSPIFVFIFTTLVTRHERMTVLKLAGAIIGISGVCMIVGLEALQGLGAQVAAQLACLLGAALYGCAAIYGKRFTHISATATAAGTMIWASIVLVPSALVFERPWLLEPSRTALFCVITLALLCTGVALLLYFRLVRTLGSLGVASQAYLRAGVGVVLGMVVLGEQLTPTVALGLAAAVFGVALINWPGKT